MHGFLRLKHLYFGDWSAVISFAYTLTEDGSSINKTIIIIPLKSCNKLCITDIINYIILVLPQFQEDIKLGHLLSQNIQNINVLCH